MNTVSLVGILTIITTFLLEISPAGGMFDQIKADISQAKSAGFNGTPSLVIGDTVKTGIMSWETFKNILEEKRF